MSHRIQTAHGALSHGRVLTLAGGDRQSTHNHNLFAHPASEIHEARTVLTLVEGERVFTAPDFI